MLVVLYILNCIKMEEKLNVELVRTFIQAIVAYFWVLSWQNLLRLTRDMRSLNCFAVKSIENRTPVLLQYFAGVPQC
jgi:hypothetical protein